MQIMQMKTSRSRARAAAGDAPLRPKGLARGTVVALAIATVTLMIAGAASSETISGATLEIHEAEVVSGGVPRMSNGSQSLLVKRSTVAGSARGYSQGPSGLQLQGGVVAVPEASPALQGIAAVLGLGLLAARRSAVRS